MFNSHTVQLGGGRAPSPLQTPVILGFGSDRCALGGCNAGQLPQCRRCRKVRLSFISGSSATVMSFGVFASLQRDPRLSLSGNVLPPPSRGMKTGLVALCLVALCHGTRWSQSRLLRRHTGTSFFPWAALVWGHSTPHWQAATQLVNPRIADASQDDTWLLGSPLGGDCPFSLGPCPWHPCAAVATVLAHGYVS